jgi:hypothetical protein
MLIGELTIQGLTFDWDRSGDRMAATASASNLLSVVGGAAVSIPGRMPNVPRGLSVWMAGGGIKRGVIHRATVELGCNAVENRQSTTEVHAHGSGPLLGRAQLPSLQLVKTIAAVDRPAAWQAFPRAIEI